MAWSRFDIGCCCDGEECFYPPNCFNTVCPDLNGGVAPEKRSAPCVARITVAGVTGDHFGTCCNCDIANGVFYLRNKVTSGDWVGSFLPDGNVLPPCWQIDYPRVPASRSGYHSWAVSIFKPAGSSTWWLKASLLFYNAGRVDVFEGDTGIDSCVGLPGQVFTLDRIDGVNNVCDFPETVDVEFFDESDDVATRYQFHFYNQDLGGGVETNIVPYELALTFSGVADGTCQDCEALLNRTFHLWSRDFLPSQFPPVVGAVIFQWRADERSCGCVQSGGLSASVFDLYSIDIVTTSDPDVMKIRLTETRQGRSTVVNNARVEWTSTGGRVNNDKAAWAQENMLGFGWTKTTTPTGPTDCDLSAITLDSVAVLPGPEQYVETGVIDQGLCQYCRCEMPDEIKVFGIDQIFSNDGAQPACLADLLEADGSVIFTRNLCNWNVFCETSPGGITQGVTGLVSIQKQFFPTQLLFEFDLTFTGGGLGSTLPTRARGAIAVEIGVVGSDQDIYSPDLVADCGFGGAGGTEFDATVRRNYAFGDGGILDVVTLRVEAV